MSERAPPTATTSKSPAPATRRQGGPPRHRRTPRRQLSQIAINSFRCLPPLGDRPDHQRLSAPHVARREHARNARHVVASAATLPRPSSQRRLLDHAVLHRPREAHRQQHQIGVQREFRSGDRLELRRRTHSQRMQLLHIAVLVAGELNCIDAPIARATLFVRALDRALHRPHWPRRRRQRVSGGFGSSSNCVTDRAPCRCPPKADPKLIQQAAIAHLVEHQFPKLKAAGSSPVRRSGFRSF